MSMRQWAPVAALAGLLTLALLAWPLACSLTASPEASVAGSSGPSSATPEALVSPGLARLLPHPAFAHAATPTPGTVTIADVAEKAAPSVVNVSSSRKIKQQLRQLPFMDDPIFRHFFGPGAPGRPAPRGRGGPLPEQKGVGSGVIVSADGIVLTNNHVVAGAESILVTTTDGRELDAKVVGTDERSDLAVLKLEGEIDGLKPIAFGDSSRLRLGDVVLAIGNPFGVGQTITMGIVSAKGRANVGIVDYEDFIQTDAAINPGNSGGALVDMEGKLVGINTAILSRSGGYMGIGFAIPSNMAQPISESLRKHGKVVRGWLGVGIQDVDQDLATALSLPTADGVLVSEVREGSPAAKAGLERGDVVLSLNGTKMQSTGQLRNAVAAAGADAKVTVEVLRSGKRKQVKVTLGELPQDAEPKPSSAAGKQRGAEPSALDGLTLENLDAKHRRRFEVDASVKAGAVVIAVEPGSLAARAGLRPGDVIVETNRQPVTSVPSFDKAYQRSKKVVLLVLNRRGRTIYLTVKRS